MTKHLQMPLRFRFLRFETKWTYNHPSHLREATGVVDVLAPTTELNGWDIREEFFKLPRGKTAYLDFLNKVGLFFGLGVSRPFAVAPPLANDKIWNFRDEMRSALKQPKKFIAEYAQGPWSRTQSTTFELDGKVPFLKIETTCFYDLLITTICADLVQGFRFHECQREDCRMPFAAETAHKRKFCSQYCGHLVSMRKQRNAAKNTSRKNRRG
jgi:hypothetical protein